MARTVPSSVSSVLAASGHQCDWTLDLTFPNLNAFYYATAVFNGLNGHNYSNDLESVSDIRNTLEAPADQVTVRIQNLDRILGQYLAANWQQFRQAQAVLGRYYWNDTKVSIGWFEMFRGAVQQPNADDFAVTFAIIPDTNSAGQLVATRTLNPTCQFKFKDLRTCAYTGGLTTCNHHLASPGGCDGRANSHHFGGTEHRYATDVRPPGVDGNDDDDGGDIIHNPCPRLDQYTRVKGPDGRPVVKMVGFLTDEDYLWHPVKRTFNKIRRTRVVKDQRIWLIRGPRRIQGFSSGPHPVIRDASDAKGTPVEQMRRGNRFLIDDAGLEAVDCRLCVQVGDDDVLLIEIDADDPADQIYCYGDSMTGPMIVCHNYKDDPILD